MPTRRVRKRSREGGATDVPPTWGDFLVGAIWRTPAGVAVWLLAYFWLADDLTAAQAVVVGAAGAVAANLLRPKTVWRLIGYWFEIA